MRRSLFRMYAGILLLLPACKPSIKTTPPPADAPAEVVAMTGASVMIAAGDIASCTSQGDELTAALVDSVLRADSAAVVEDVVAALGDNAYPDGSDQNFALCFTPSWGDSAKRIIQRIRPAPGNHEFSIFGASPYFEYFGKKAGEPRKGYYSYSIGDWHAVVLNSEIVVNPVFTAEDRKAQMDWLNDDLKFNTKKCTVAYWHNPRFSSGWHGSDRLLTEFWQVLFANNVDLILNGHDHDYERFKPMTPAGLADSTQGIVEIVVGTGGGELRGMRNTVVPNSAARVQGHFGVVKLTLGKEQWRSAFLSINGQVYDPSGGNCH